MVHIENVKNRLDCMVEFHLVKRYWEVTVLMYAEDESVQSWVFRLALLSGEYKYNSLIGIDGKWYSTPSLVKGCAFNLHLIPDLDLLRFLRRSGIANKKASMFDNPVDYIDQMSIINPSNNSSSNAKGEITIRFCKECIAESIKKNGYGYFKAEWLSKIYCSNHGINLIELISKNRKSVVKELLQAFAGTPVIQSQTSVALDKDSHQYREAKTDFSYHIMPCLLNEFYMWASRKSDDALLKYEHLDFFYVNGVRKKISDEYLHYKFIYFLEYYPKQLKEFLDRTVELKEYKFGFRQKLSLSETLAKSRSKNCSKCSDWGKTGFCPIEPILVTRLKHEHSTHCKTNACDFFLKYRTHWYG